MVDSPTERMYCVTELGRELFICYNLIDEITYVLKFTCDQFLLAFNKWCYVFNTVYHDFRTSGKHILRT